MGYLAKLRQDVRFIEGLKACNGCGVCTAICPAAALHSYDPRQITDIVQQGKQSDIELLLKSDTIWFCGECLSCKTRCPRGNTPGYIIQALRALSIETGLFIHSMQGQKQLAIKRMVGEHILKYGYSVFIDEIDTDQFPEQGPVWDWFKANKIDVLQRLHTSYNQQQPGSLRQMAPDDLDDLKRIFDETGATLRFKKIEHYASVHAAQLNLNFDEGKDAYFDYLYHNNQPNPSPHETSHE